MKKYAIEVFFNQEFDNYVRNLWRQCDFNNLSTFMNRVKGTEPHIALAVYENIELTLLEKRFNQFIEQDLFCFQLRFDAAAYFPTTKVTFLQPNVKKQLVDLMMRIHEHFQDFKVNCNPYYQPERWFPHVTIGYNQTNEDLKKTVNFVIDNFTPQDARIEKLALVEIEYIDGEVFCRNISYKELFNR